MSRPSYSEALDIARELANATTKAAERLRAKCTELNRQPTFVIMRYGDPRGWVGRLPKVRDNRTEAPDRLITRKRGRPKTPRLTYEQAVVIAAQVMLEGGVAAETLKRRAKILARMRYANPAARVVERDGDPRTWSETVYRTANPRTTKDWRQIVQQRPVTLQHAETGVIAKCASIVDFCAKHIPNGSTSDRYHVTPVLDGDRTSFKGWYLPETLAQVVKLRDIYDNVTSYTVRDLLTTHGLTSTTVFHLLSGRKRSLNNLMLAETPVGTDLRPKATKITEVTLTNGRRTVKAPSLSQAARKAGIETSMANVYSAAYGFKEEVRGFRVAEIKTERKRVISNV